MRCTLLFAMVVATLSSFATADEQQELISYFELHKSNWSSISQMDVLCRTDRIREPAVSDGFTETVYERFIFDWNAERFTYVRVGQREPLSGEGKAETVETGFIINDGKYRSFKKRKLHLVPRKVTKREAIFDDHRMPDLRTLMFMTISRGGIATWTQNRANAFDVYPQTAVSIKSLGRTDKAIRYEMFFDNNAGVQWDFDVEQLMPTRTKWLVKREGAEKALVVGNETLEWQEEKGIFVPTVIQGDYRNRQTRFSPEQMEEEISKLPKDQQTREIILNTIKKFYIDVIENRDMRFHWISINEPLGEDKFDFKMIDEPEKFVALTDAKRVGASGLVDETQ